MEKNELSLDELKKIETQILSQVHELCQQQNFRYSMCGGTLLGAVRHKGYIPWDDDIDIFMPRPDYNKLIEYCQTHETPFKLICNETEPNYGYLFAKAVSKETVIVDDNTDLKGIDMGVYIDIFPIDGLADTYEKSKKLFNKTRFKRELLVARNWTKFFRSKTRAWYYEPIRFAFYVLSRFTSKRRLVKSIQSKYKNINFDECNYCATVCGAYRLKEIMPLDTYVGYIDLDFEGLKFKAMKNYDNYLSTIFGDYMQLPPEDKRVTHHTFKAYYRKEV